MRKAALSTIPILLFSTSLLAQSTAMPPLTEQVDVKVINVDVTVTDASGKPVPGLTKGDFEIYEDGVRQNVTNFYAIEHTAAVKKADDAAPQPVAPSAHFTRKIALLIDNNYIEKVPRDAAIDMIDRFIDQSLSGDDEWAVAVVGERAEILQTFTHDRAAIHKAIAAVRAMPAFPARSEMNRAILSDPDRRKEESAPSGQTDGNAAAFKEAVRFQAREQTWRAFHAIEGTSRAVADIARTYAATDGRKVMVLVTGGMETNTTFMAYDSGFDEEIQQTKLAIGKTIDDMVHDANAANFTIDVINARPRGMIAPQHDVQNKSAGLPPNLFLSHGGNEPVDTTDRDSSSLTITTGTGGSYLTSNRMESSLALIDAQTSTYYSLGYKPAHEDDRQYHRIAVKVKRSGVRVSHRAGYVDLSPEDRLEQFLRARLSTVTPGGTLPVQIEVGAPIARADQQVAVPLTAEMPMDKVTVIPVDGQLTGRVHVYVSVFDADDNNIGFDHHLQEVKMSPEQYENAGLFRYTLKVRLGKGAFKVLVTLRDDLSNEIGSAVQVVHL